MNGFAYTGISNTTLLESKILGRNIHIVVFVDLTQFNNTVIGHEFVESVLKECPPLLEFVKNIKGLIKGSDVYQNLVPVGKNTIRARLKKEGFAIPESDTKV